MEADGFKEGFAVFIEERLFSLSQRSSDAALGTRSSCIAKCGTMLL